MQLCTKCNTQNADSVHICTKCGADLDVFSNYAVTLKKFRGNPRVRGVRISVNEDACPVCQQARGSYPLEHVPKLPIVGCSNPNGCKCAYVPWLQEIYP